MDANSHGGLPRHCEAAGARAYDRDHMAPKCCTRGIDGAAIKLQRPVAECPAFGSGVLSGPEFRVPSAAVRWRTPDSGRRRVSGTRNPELRTTPDYVALAAMAFSAATSRSASAEVLNSAGVTRTQSPFARPLRQTVKMPCFSSNSAATAWFSARPVRPWRRKDVIPATESPIVWRQDVDTSGALARRSPIGRADSAPARP